MFEENENKYWEELLKTQGKDYVDREQQIFHMHKSFIYYLLQVKDVGWTGPFIVLFDKGKYKNKFDTLEVFDTWYYTSDEEWGVERAEEILEDEIKRNMDSRADFNMTLSAFSSFYDSWADIKFKNNFYPGCADDGKGELYEDYGFDLGIQGKLGSEDFTQNVICNFLFASPHDVIQYHQLVAKREAATSRKVEKIHEEKMARADKERLSILEGNAGLEDLLGGARGNKNKRNKNKRKRKKRTRKKRTRKKRTRKKRTRKKRTRKKRTRK